VERCSEDHVMADQGVAIVERVAGVPYSNVIVAVLPTAGLAGFYARHGFRALGAECPVMQRWVNGARGEEVICGGGGGGAGG
jgi:hypothetical protein